MTAIAEGVFTFLIVTFLLWLATVLGAYLLGLNHGKRFRTAHSVARELHDGLLDGSVVPSDRDYAKVWESGGDPPAPNEAAKEAAKRHIQRKDRFTKED